MDPELQAEIFNSSTLLDPVEGCEVDLQTTSWVKVKVQHQLVRTVDGKVGRFDTAARQEHKLR